MKKKIQEAKLKGEMNNKFSTKNEKEKPKIFVKMNLPQGVESEWGRMIRRGLIKKQQIQVQGDI